jgi:hypothetical protein
MGRGRARGGQGSLARVVPEFGRAGRNVRYGWSAVATERTMRAGRDVREDVDGYSDGLCRTCVPILSDHHTISHLQEKYRYPFREPLQFIVIAVMSVTNDTFPYTYGVFYVTINSWRVRGPSRHRHGERHRRNVLPKRLPRYRDGDDAHDADIRAYSRQGALLYFVGSLTAST